MFDDVISGSGGVEEERSGQTDFPATVSWWCIVWPHTWTQDSYPDPGRWVTNQPISCIIQPISCIIHPISCIIQPISCIIQPISCIIQPISCIIQPIKLILGSWREHDTIHWETLCKVRRQVEEGGRQELFSHSSGNIYICKPATECKIVGNQHIWRHTIQIRIEGAHCANWKTNEIF